MNDSYELSLKISKYAISQPSPLQQYSCTGILSFESFSDKSTHNHRLEFQRESNHEIK